MLSSNTRIQFAQGLWSCEIDLHGGRIIQLSYGNQTVLGSYSRIDGKQGNTHLCVPSFADEGGETYGLPFHGPARGSMWKMVEHDVLSIRCVLPKTEKYSAELEVIQRFTFSDKVFSQIVIVTHLGGKPVPVNIGIHNYWDAPNGWEDLKINNRSAVRLVKINGRVPLKKENILEFSSGNKIQWKVNGFSEAVLWSAFRGTEYDTSYVCIEPVSNQLGMYGQADTYLGLQEQKKVTQSITVIAADP